jgi:uncharacterized membrane protein YsdA (DUF1294 family)
MDWRRLRNTLVIAAFPGTLIGAGIADMAARHRTGDIVVVIICLLVMTVILVDYGKRT